MPLFEDPFSSYRGPGVIGLLLGALVLAACVVLGIFVIPPAPRPEERVERNAALIEAKEQDLSGLSKRVDTARERERAHEELARLRSEITASAKTATTLEAEAAQLKGEIVAIKESWWAHRRAVRKAAIDEPIATLPLRDGRGFEGVTIREVTHLKMRILHDGGNAHIAGQLLPQFLQDRFQFDPQEPPIATPPSVPKDPSPGLRRNVRKLEQDIFHLREDIAGKEKEIANDMKRIAVNQRKIQQLMEDAGNERHLDEEARRKGNWSAHLAVAQQREREAARLRGINNELQARIKKAKARIGELEDEIRERERKIEETRKMAAAAKSRLAQEEVELAPRP